MLPILPGMTLLDRMVLGVERVRDRLLRASTALEAAGVPYAVVGGNAVAAWVATVDSSAVRNTPDVDILLRRTDLEAAAAALEIAGFVRRREAGLDIFLDGPDGKSRDAVHVMMAGEKVRPEYAAAAPDVAESEKLGGFRVVRLEALVRMKLTSFRNIDYTHLRDMLEIGLIDGSWKGRIGPELGGAVATVDRHPGTLMRAIVVRQFGDPKLLKVQEIPTPQPGDGEALVEVKAAGVNPSDVKNIQGVMHGTTLPRIPGRDFAGVVVRGPAQTIGHEVWGTGGDIGFTRDGSHAQYILLPSAALTPKPANLSMEAAGSAGLIFVTAWSALMTAADVSHTETVLVIGASGGVGSAAVQIARSRHHCHRRREVR